MFLLGGVTMPLDQILGFQLAAHFAFALLQNTLGGEDVAVTHCA